MSVDFIKIKKAIIDKTGGKMKMNVIPATSPKPPHNINPNGIIDLIIVNSVENILPCISLGIVTCKIDIN